MSELEVDDRIINQPVQLPTRVSKRVMKNWRPEEGSWVDVKRPWNRQKNSWYCALVKRVRHPRAYVKFVLEPFEDWYYYDKGDMRPCEGHPRN